PPQPIPGREGVHHRSASLATRRAGVRAIQHVPAVWAVPVWTVPVWTVPIWTVPVWTVLRAGLREPGIAPGEQVLDGDVVEHTLGLPEAVGHLADHGDPRGGHRRQVAGGPVPAGTEVLPNLDGGRVGEAVLLRGGQLGGAQQPGRIDRAEGVGGRVV